MSGSGLPEPWAALPSLQRGAEKALSASVLLLKLEDHLPSHKINYTLFFLLGIRPLVNSFHVKELHFV